MSYQQISRQTSHARLRTHLAPAARSGYSKRMFEQGRRPCLALATCLPRVSAIGKPAGTKEG